MSSNDTVWPASVQSWVGKSLVKTGPVMVAQRELWISYCVAVEDSNPLYWGEGDSLAPKPIAPPAMLPSWVIDHDWHPDVDHTFMRTLELHFRLKDALNLPYGVVVSVELEFHRPVKEGDRLRAEQILLELGEEYQTRMGPGRRWTIVVNYYHDDEALAGVQTLYFISYRKEAE